LKPIYTISIKLHFQAFSKLNRYFPAMISLEHAVAAERGSSRYGIEMKLRIKKANSGGRKSFFQLLLLPNPRKECGK
jgi:hypothetical protein